MERRFTTKTKKSIAAILSILLFVIFTFRRTYCDYRFPGMYEHYLEWDGSNTFTMNMFAIMFFISFSFNRALCGILNWSVAIFFTDIVCGISGSDVVDRFLLHIHNKTENDNAVLFYTIILTAAWLFISQKYVRRSSSGSK